MGVVFTESTLPLSGCMSRQFPLQAEKMTRKIFSFSAQQVHPPLNTRQTNDQRPLRHRSHFARLRIYRRLCSIKTHPNPPKFIEKSRADCVAWSLRDTGRFLSGFSAALVPFFQVFVARGLCWLFRRSHGNPQNPLQKTQHKNGPACFARGSGRPQRI